MTRQFLPEAAVLADNCRSIFGDESTWITADGYPDSLALAIIDSIFSTGSHYQSVINVVNKYRAHRQGQGGNAELDGTEELLQSFKEVRGSSGWAALVDNHKPAHTKANAVLKAEVVLQAANALDALGITTGAAMHVEYARDASLSRVKDLWLKLPGQSSGVTFNYLLILTGFQSVKPDRMVMRFIEEHAGLEHTLTPMAAAGLISQVADLYPTERSKLDHVIWRHVSGRETYRAVELS